MRLRSVVLVGLGLLWAGSAAAATLTFNLDVEFSGAADPQGATPWVTITLDDSVGGANDVRITIDNVNLVGAEFTSGVYLNFDPALDPTLLSFSAVDNSDSVPTISTGVDAFKADGDGFFDILFDFPPPPGSFAAKFTAGESVVYDITYTSAIDVGSFDFESVMGGGNGAFRAAAHVQGIVSGDGDSGWIGVPEPAAALLLLPGLVALAGRRRS